MFWCRNVLVTSPATANKQVMWFKPKTEDSIHTNSKNLWIVKTKLLTICVLISQDNSLNKVIGNMLDDLGLIPSRGTLGALTSLQTAY
jgi:hypothetical protein